MTYAGLPFSSGPRTTLERLAAFAPPEQVDVEGEEDPAEGMGTDWHELLTVLDEPEALPPEVKERIERAGKGLGEALKEARFARQGERSTADYRLCCTCARFGFSERDAALILAAYGSEKVAEKFVEDGKGFGLRGSHGHGRLMPKSRRS